MKKTETHPPVRIIDFQKQPSVRGWTVVNDGVMGGLSRGTFTLASSGAAVFRGHVSTQNNGGFTSIRRGFDALDVEAHRGFAFRVRGDGKRYQFRVRADSSDRHNYVAYFPTSGAWETVTLGFEEMAANFRGRRLPLPPFPGERLAELGFLIGNKREEDFQLFIQWVALI